MERENSRIVIVSIYGEQGGKNLEDKLKRIKLEESEKEGRDLIIGGDSNVRIGEMGRDEIETGGKDRSSKDKGISNGGRGLVGKVIENGWHVLMVELQEIGKANIHM